MRERSEHVGRDDVGSFEKVWVITDFSELHDEVHQVLGACRVGEIVGLGDEVGNGDALTEGFVDVSLALG